MKAVVQYKALPCSEPLAFVDADIPDPIIGENDVLVRVDAISVNPADYRVRMRKQDNGKAVVLGWDVAGCVVAMGAQVKNFSVDDQVWYAGDINRPGANSEYHAVDHRLIAIRPTNISVEAAAAMPLTLLTAWEALFDQLDIPIEGDSIITTTDKTIPQITPKAIPKTLLIIGAAGGVGSIAVQMAKLIPNITVIATASRQESKDWCLSNGADHVINHHQDIKQQLHDITISEVDYCLILSDPDGYFPLLDDLVNPFGKVCSIVPFKAPVDLNVLMSKSITFTWELMFTHSMYNTYNMDQQGEILKRCAALVEKGELKTTVNQVLSPINANNILLAHQTLESGSMIGKLTIKN